MKTKCWFFAKLTFVLWISYTLSVVMAQPQDPEQQARQILDATGVNRFYRKDKRADCQTDRKN